MFAFLLLFLLRCPVFALVYHLISSLWTALLCPYFTHFCPSLLAFFHLVLGLFFPFLFAALFSTFYDSHLPSLSLPHFYHFLHSFDHIVGCPIPPFACFRLPLRSLSFFPSFSSYFQHSFSLLFDLLASLLARFFLLALFFLFLPFLHRCPVFTLFYHFFSSFWTALLCPSLCPFFTPFCPSFWASFHLVLALLFPFLFAVLFFTFYDSHLPSLSLPRFHHFLYSFGHIVGCPIPPFACF